MALQIDTELLTLPVGEIIAHPAIQQRVSMDREKVAEYAELYGEGRDLGRLVVFQTDEGLLLADGFHRLEAARTLNLPTLPCAVSQGSQREAILFATSCNLHGKALSNQDKRKRVTTLLTDPEWSSWSDNHIARHCGVAQSFVSKLRHDLSLNSEISEGTTSPSLNSEISDDGSDVLLNSEIRENGTVPTRRTYTNRYGRVSTMNTRAIGQQAPAPLPEGQGRAPEVPEGDEADSPAILTEVQDQEPPERAPSWPQTVSSGDPEWYTPAEVLALVRAVLGQIDVDPASCALAQATVQARTYYTREDDGLSQPWPGTVYLNPPYKLPDVGHFIGKLFEELDAQRTTAAILLVNNATETDWFQGAFARANAVCFPNGRIRFVSPTHAGLAGPCQGQALLYYGPDSLGFCRVFAALGVSTLVRCAPAAQLPLAATPPASVPQAEPVPSADDEQDKVRLSTAVWQVVKQLQPCTNAAVAKALDKRPGATHRVLQALVKQGTVARKGDAYRVVVKKQ